MVRAGRGGADCAREATGCTSNHSTGTRPIRSTTSIAAPAVLGWAHDDRQESLCRSRRRRRDRVARGIERASAAGRACAAVFAARRARDRAGRRARDARRTAPLPAGRDAGPARRHPQSVPLRIEPASVGGARPPHDRTRRGAGSINPGNRRPFPIPKHTPGR